MPKLYSLQSLRLFAAICIVEFHLWHNYLGITIGHPGTDFFLVLVGLVAAYTQRGYITQGRWGGYLAARGVRLYVTFAPLFLIAVFFKRQEATWEWVLRSFFFLPQPDRFPVIGATWMISHFLLFYALFALVIWSRREHLIWGIFLLWTIGISSYMWGGWQTHLPAEWASLLFAERNLDFIFGYAAGVLLRQRAVSPFWARRLAWLGAAGVIAGTVALNVGASMDGRSLWIGLPVTAFVLGVAALEQHAAPSILVSILSQRWLVALGAASYVIYLSHGMAIALWSRFLPVTPLSAPLITACALAVGVLGYRLWEAPLMARTKRRLAFAHGLSKPYPAQSSPSSAAPSSS
jgi:exopolysaccharide production protein ExoZ